MQTPERAQREILKLSEALLLCQRELAQVREDQEPLMEECSRLRSECNQTQSVLAEVSGALAEHLSQQFWQERQPATAISWRRFIGSRWPWLRGLMVRSSPISEENAQIRLIEQSPLFQPAWYLQQYADVARAGIHPAAHYLLSGAAEGRDPGPEFSTADYLAAHPEVEQARLNPLLHNLQAQDDSAAA